MDCPSYPERESTNISRNNTIISFGLAFLQENENHIKQNAFGSIISYNKPAGINCIANTFAIYLVGVCMCVMHLSRKYARGNITKLPTIYRFVTKT
jgi:hypothetical protein